ASAGFFWPISGGAGMCVLYPAPLPEKKGGPAIILRSRGVRHRVSPALARPPFHGERSMCRKFWKQILAQLGRRRPRRPTPWENRTRPHLETLDERIAPAVTASFVASTGVLSVLGDAKDNTIIVSRDNAGTLLVNGGNVAVKGGTATVANTALI